MIKPTKEIAHNSLEKPKFTSSKQLIHWGVASIVLATLIVYLPAIRAGFTWDDDDNVYENTPLETFSGIAKIWSLKVMKKPDGQRYITGYTQQYYPMVHSSFWLETRLWGNQNPTGFHVVNVLLHIANALLVWLICRRLGFSWGYLVALIFALHPVEVESVAWITVRKNVLSGLFFMVALLSYLRFDKSSRKVFYFVALGCFILALLAKTVTCTLPAILLLIFWMKHGRIPWAHALRLIPFFIIGAALGLFTAHYELHSVGTTDLGLQFEFWQRWVIAGRALFFYAWKLLWPNLIFIYPRWNPAEFSRLDLLWPAAGITLTIVLWAMRKAIGRAPFVAWAGFVVSLFPALGFFDVYYFRYSFVADHWQYLASIFLIALFVGLAHSLYKRLRSMGPKILDVPSTPVIFGLCLLLLLGSLTYNQARIYNGIERLWQTTVSKNHRAWIAWNNLGILYEAGGDFGKAVHHYSQAIKADPSFAETYNNRGGLYVGAGNYDQGIRDLNKALELNPKLAEACFNRGLAYWNKGQRHRAIRDFEKSVQLALDTGKKELAQGIQRRLELYKANRPSP